MDDQCKIIGIATFYLYISFITHGHRLQSGFLMTTSFKVT